MLQLLAADFNINMTVTTPGNERLFSNYDKDRNNLDQIQQLVATEIEAVNQTIQRELTSDIVLVNQISRYIINSGGKRLRPLLLLLASKAIDYQGKHHVTLAAIIEFIHTATLLHDDVVDESELRRGKDTANTVWGNAASVLVGDFLYSRSFEMMVSVGNYRIMEIMSKTTTAIAEGEVLQLLNCNNPATTETEYLTVISRKTAILFRAAAQLAAVIGESSDPTETALADFGTHLGVAFQLIDDALDYQADPENLGKSLGDDLAEGKPTLPLIHAIQNTDPAGVEIISNAITSGDRSAFESVFKVIESTNSIEYTIQRAEEEAKKAMDSLSTLKNSPYKEALATLAQFSVQRAF